MVMSSAYEVSCSGAGCCVVLGVHVEECGYERPALMDASLNCRCVYVCSLKVWCALRCLM